MSDLQPKLSFICEENALKMSTQSRSSLWKFENELDFRQERLERGYRTNLMSPNIVLLNLLMI